ncbi:hypothetical protein TARUN_3606 [Trichoderma arundinaceum]|uniref:Uncharacterized protein n=1 Tax=Trichoderma arundinaceum TaxID=490622 RepID=A0A395NRD5_TRIAR|nr:hypothetical protein TARUN_3606 [Trichoderma arundinaceum]
MKVIVLASTLVALASSAATALGGVEYLQWWDAGCNGRALLSGGLTQGFCTVFENFPGQSIKLTQTSPCPAGTSAVITVSSTNNCDAEPDWTFEATGECLDVSIQPQAIHLNCV